MSNRKMLRVLGFILAAVILVQSNASAIYAAQGGDKGNSNSIENKIKKEIPKLPDLLTKKPEKIPPGIAKNEDKFEKWKDKKEIVENRTIDSKTFDNGDGTNTLVQYFKPIHVKDAKGKYVDIDNSLVAETSKDATINYKNKLGIYDILFSNANKTPTIQVKNDNISIELIPNDATTKNITVEDNQVMYTGHVSGINYLYTVLDSGVKEDIVLNHFVDIDTFTYELKVPGGADVVEENGEILVVDKKTGLSNMTLSAPVMSDADGNQSRDLSLSLDRKGFGNSYKVTLKVDKAWLGGSGKGISGKDRSECIYKYF